MPDCLFCKIMRRIPAESLRDEHTFAFEDIQPQLHARSHHSKKHVRGLEGGAGRSAELVGRLHLAAAEIGRQRGIEDGYRTVLNVGPKVASRCSQHVHLVVGAT